MKRIKLLTVLTSSLLMAGCITVGPDYAVPHNALVNAPFANGPIDGVESHTATGQPVSPEWWHLYDDPVLNDLIERALRSNTDLRVAAANLERSRAEVGFAQAQGGFGGATSAGARRERLSGEEYLMPEQVPMNTNVDAGISISYQIDLFGMLRRAVEAAQADDDAVRAASDVTRITVVADVVRAYVQSCSAAEELGIAQRSVDIQKQRTAITRRLADVGRSNTTDVTRDEAEIQSLEAEVPRFVADRRIAQYKLAALLSIAPGALPPKVLSCERTPAIDQPIPVGDGAALLKRRPDVRQAERKLAAATARIGVAVGALYPSISIGASAGLTGASKDLGSPQTQRYGYGPLISWTFPVNGERERVKEARAESDAQLARFDGVVLDALRETETSLAANAADVQRISALHGSLEMASRSADQTHSLYEAGRDSFISDLDATRTLNVSRAKLAAAQAQLALDQVTLFLALGGGWEGADKTAQNASVANNQSGRRD